MRLLDRFQELLPPDDLRDGIAQNLRHLLAARARFAAAAPDFGLSDLDSQRDGDAVVRTLLPEILRNVERYEPRLKSCTVETAGRDADLSLRLLLSGQVDGAAARFLIHWNPVYGDVRVEVVDV